jgi:ATP-dependent helicase/nuclease subunit A
MVLHDRSVAPIEAVRRAAGVTGLGDRLDEAVADVDRALTALESAGLRRSLGPDFQIEYPVAGAGAGGVLLGGYIDLVSATAGQLDVLDFKTDAPPAGAVEGQYPEYVRQLRSYADLLAAAGVPAGRTVRCGLLFTSDGGIRWVVPA